jgi:hypothetical protein
MFFNFTSGRSSSEAAWHSGRAIMPAGHPAPPRSSNRSRPRTSGSLVLPLVLLAVLAVAATGYVASVLRPSWPGAATAPDLPSLPISVGGVVFNIPPGAIRIAVQRQPGAQERVDLTFLWPSLAPPEPAARPAVSDEAPALDRLFLTLAVADGTLTTAQRLKAIYPRYLEDVQLPGPDGLLVLRFRDSSPYRGEDLFFDPASPETFAARCTRPVAGMTPGICLLERRLDAAELTWRFPRDWLADWRSLVKGSDRLLAGLRPGSGQKP